MIINAVQYHLLNVYSELRQNKKDNLFQYDIRKDKSDYDDYFFDARTLPGKKR